MTPKEQFLKTPHAKGHADLVESEQFRQACNYAMLALMADVTHDFPNAADWISGAHRFLYLLQTIATPAPEALPLTTPKLRHDAYDARRR